jgi:hypothetical protein
MKFLTLALLCGFPAFGQTLVPDKWAGIWVLNVEKSTFGEILFPGAPDGFKVVSQTVRISGTAREIKLSGDTVFSDRDGSHTGHDDGVLRLDGTETTLGPGSLSFRRIDDSKFEILSKMGAIREVSEFNFSSDGKTLTETKTQTATDKKTSTSVLLFSKSATAK